MEIGPRWRIIDDSSGDIAKRNGKELDGGGYFEYEPAMRKVRSLNAAATQRRKNGTKTGSDSGV
jgi:hypothetical protein